MTRFACSSSYNKSAVRPTTVATESQVYLLHTYTGVLARFARVNQLLELLLCVPDLRVETVSRVLEDGVLS